MDSALAFVGSASVFTAGDLSGVVASGSTQVDVRFKNISDFPIKMWYRKTGTSGVGENTDISPQESSGNITIALTTARTIEYYIEGGGTVECWVVDYRAGTLSAVSSTTYTTAAKVASLLRLINQSTQARKVFDGTTDPTLTEVENYCLEAESIIDKETNHSWKASTVTNEYHNVGRLYTGFYRRELPVKLKHRSIRQFVSGTDKIEFWNGVSWVDLVLAANGYTEARNQDYWVDYTSGIIYLISTKPYYAEKGIRVTYRYGEASVPYAIQEAATKLAACKILENEDYKVVLPEGVSQYGIASKVESWKKDIARILENHREHFSAV